MAKSAPVSSFKMTPPKFLFQLLVIGGCTVHNAMIMVYPHNKDWQDIADSTSDPSWSPEKMRGYFQKLENCHHRPFERLLHFLTGLNPTRHGFGGWLRTEKAAPLETIVGDRELLQALLRGATTALRDSGEEATELLEGIETALDPNDWVNVQRNGRGLHYTPLSTNGHVRTGPRDRLLDVRKRHPDRLHIGAVMYYPGLVASASKVKEYASWPSTLCTL